MAEQPVNPTNPPANPNPETTQTTTRSTSTSTRTPQTTQQSSTPASTPSTPSGSSQTSKSGECELLRGSCKNEVKFIAKNNQGAEIKVCEEHKHLVDDQYPDYTWEFEEIK